MTASTADVSPAGRSDMAHHLHPYTQLRQLEREGPLVIVRGDGVHVIDEHGKRYLEGMAGLWCASLGFSESRLADAADRPTGRCAHCPATTRSRARCQAR